MYMILDALVKLLAPVLCFTTEEIWSMMPHKKGDDMESVLFNEFPVFNDAYVNADIEEKFDKILKVRADVSKALEMARNDKVIGHSLNANVELYATGELYTFLKGIEDELSTIFIVSKASITEGDMADATFTGEEYPELKVKVSQAPGEKCERCWMFSETVGENSAHPTLCSRCASVIE